MRFKVADKKIDFNRGDRVRRTGSEGPFGTVENIRVETLRQSIKESNDAPGIAITVLWDNGTKSHFVPGALDKVK